MENLENNQNENNENLENSNNQNLREKNRAIFENNANENSENSNSKFKLSGWDKFKILLSILFVIYGWFYYLSYPNPKSIDELQTCVGEIISLDIYQARGVTRFFLKVQVDGKKMEFGLNNLNSVYGITMPSEALYYKKYNVYSNKKFMENINLLSNKMTKIWYANLPMPSNANKRAYQVQILDFADEKNPNLKELEYLVNFMDNSHFYQPFNIFLLIAMNGIFLITIIKILIKLRRTKCQI